MTGWPAGKYGNRRGASGRVGLFELLTVDPVLRDRIRETGCHLETIRAAAMASGMKPLIQDGIEKVLAGDTSMEDVLSAAAI